MAARDDQQLDRRVRISPMTGGKLTLHSGLDVASTLSCSVPHRWS